MRYKERKRRERKGGGKVMRERCLWKTKEEGKGKLKERKRERESVRCGWVRILGLLYRGS